MLWMPVVMVAAAALAVLILRGATGQPHVQETVAAALIALVAAELAAVPVLLARGGGQAAMVQAALIGTVAHMFVCFLLAAAGYALQVVGQRNFFLFLLIGFYWVSLVGAAVSMIREVRRTAAQPGPTGSSTNANRPTGTTI